MNRRFAYYAWGLLAYNILVVLWGAFVRATGSGAGCGSHWPLCNGEVIPKSLQVETLIEYSHRLTSGILGILVLVLVIWAFRAFAKGDDAQEGGAQGTGIRRASLWTLFFIITEAAIGAGLVKMEWVAADTSVERVYTMVFHLLNTFFLLTANTLVAWFASGGKPFSLRGQAGLGVAFGAAFLGMIALGATGAIAALGDTLYLTLGVTPEDSPLVKTLVSLRIYHPLLAFVSFALIYVAIRVLAAYHPNSRALRYGYWVVGLFIVQLLCGGLNVYLKAPAWMQLIHLFITDIIWILLVVTAASALAIPQTRRESHYQSYRQTTTA
ncbi:MAG: COX15/CtaA family protein [Chloroflexota bacterium]